MAETVSIEIEKREITGSAEARRLRRRGQIPGNLYGEGRDPFAFYVPEETIRSILATGTRVVDLTANGRTQKALVQELQWDTFSTQVLHVDLIRVDATKRVQVEVSLEARGISPGVVAGGKLEQHLRRLEIECLAMEIPDAIQISINELEIGDSVTVGDLDLPEGVRIETPANTTILQVNEPVELDDEDLETTDVGPLEPEVIGKSDDDSSDDS